MNSAIPDRDFTTTPSQTRSDAFALSPHAQKTFAAVRKAALLFRSPAVRLSLLTLSLIVCLLSVIGLAGAYTAGALSFFGCLGLMLLTGGIEWFLFRRLRRK